MPFVLASNHSCVSIFGPLYPHSLRLSLHKSASVISDIYSCDVGQGEHAQHSEAKTYQESGQFKGIWELRLYFH